MNRSLALQVADLSDADLEDLKLLIAALQGASTDGKPIAGLELTAWRGYRLVRASAPVKPPPPRQVEAPFTATSFKDCLRYWAEQPATRRHFLVWGGSEKNPGEGTIRLWAKEHGADHGGRSGFRISEAWKNAGPEIRSGKLLKGRSTDDPPPERGALPASTKRYFWLASHEESARAEAQAEGWPIAVDDDPETRWLGKIQ